MSDKRAFLILGPESSGTKLLAKAFVAAGCEGDGWHKQRWDRQDPMASLIVYRRSFPHGADWPDIAQIKERFEALGYEVRAVVIIRSMRCTMASRQNNGVKRPQFRTMRAFAEIGTQMAETGLPFVWLTYEELVARPKRTLRWLFGQFGLDAPKLKVKDGNAKYD